MKFLILEMIGGIIVGLIFTYFAEPLLGSYCETSDKLRKLQYENTILKEERQLMVQQIEEHIKQIEEN